MFRPQTISSASPQDISPQRRFVPKTFRPQSFSPLLMFCPLDVSVTRRFDPKQFPSVVRRFSPYFQQMYDRTCTIGLTSMSSTHWWPSSPLSGSSRRTCSMFPLAFVAGWLQGHWWGFISRNYVVWPTFLLMNVFIALKGSLFWFLFVSSDFCHRTCLEGIQALMNKVTTEWVWLVFLLLSNRYGRDLHHRTYLDVFHPLMTIITVEWLYLVFRLYYVTSWSDLHLLACIEGVHALMNKVTVE